MLRKTFSQIISSAADVNLSIKFSPYEGILKSINQRIFNKRLLLKMYVVKNK